MVDALPSVRIPAGPITKHGAWSVLKGDMPLMWLTSPDGSVLVNLMGGVARANPMRPESVQIKELKALGASWKVISQKGATQDGETFIDALYDAAKPTMKVIVRGRDAAHTRRTVQAFEGSLDAIQQGELNFWTNELGRWWADIRMDKSIPDALSASPTSQELSIMLGVDEAFWQSEPHVTSFEFEYVDMTDSFTTAYDVGAGPNWPIHYYEGSGGGFVRSNGKQLVWVDDPDDHFTTGSLSAVVGPYKDFETDTDSQVVNIVLGSFAELTIRDSAEDHLWARMGRNLDGTWNGYGVRLSIQTLLIVLSYFEDFTETVMRRWVKLRPSLPGEKFTLIAGVEGNARHFQVQRNGVARWDHIEDGTGSPLGAAYRGIGLGVRAAGALITQATPASIRKISSGDNRAVTQSGYLDFVNNGDQPGYWDALITGPASEVKIWNGPDADVDEYVSIKNILPNQMFYIRTDPRDRIVEDITKDDPTPEEKTLFQAVREKFFNFGAQQSESSSVFGVVSPQGPVETLIKGRFSTSCAIPAKSPGKPAQKYHVKVSIDGGNAQSQIVASLTPRRRSPI